MLWSVCVSHDLSCARALHQYGMHKDIAGIAVLTAEWDAQPTQAALQRTTAVNRAPGVRSSQGPDLAAGAAADATVSVAEAARCRIAAAWSLVSFHFFTFLRSL